MSSQMMQFVRLNAAMPDKRSVGERREDFAEIYARFSPERASEQASRCEQCGVPFCQVHCPLHNNIPDWLKLAVDGRLEEAYELSSATNNMPEICGRICPQDRLCEGNCVIEQSGHGGVTIGAVEKYITDSAFDAGWVRPVRPLRELAQSVGIVGAGPAGLACAEQLRRQGYQVHVYDRYDRVGGLLIYGIPGFKLEKPIVERRARHLRDSGVHFHLASDIGGDGPTFADLRRRHDSIFIATGAARRAASIAASWRATASPPISIWSGCGAIRNSYGSRPIARHPRGSPSRPLTPRADARPRRARRRWRKRTNRGRSRRNSLRPPPQRARRRIQIRRARASCCTTAARRPDPPRTRSGEVTGPFATRSRLCGESPRSCRRSRRTC